MEIDPLEYVETQDDQPATESGKAEKRQGRLNTFVAATVAVLAAFLGLCHVKAGNIAQEMQQAQAQALDHWAWYQFRKVRSEIFQGIADQLRLQALWAPAAARGAYEKQITAYQRQAREQQARMAETQAQAESFDRQYAALNVFDDQFDLSEAFLSLALALLALSALTQKPWLFGVALVPAGLGVLIGLAGLFERNVHLQAVTKLLS
jgi:hypothetical protein